MKLSLTYDWSCSPEAFWALYFDRHFAVQLHLESLGSTSAEILSQEGDLSSGLVRTLRYGQKPNMPGPVRKIFGDEVLTTEVSTFDPATSTTTFVMTPGTMADKTHIDGSIAFAVEDGRTVETFALEAQGQDLRGRAHRRALHRSAGPRDPGEIGRLHAEPTRGLMSGARSNGAPPPPCHRHVVVHVPFTQTT